jgi:SAM-dependent methyltransferase
MFKAIRFLSDYLAFVKQAKLNGIKTSAKDWYACLDDKTESTGFDKQYLYHTAWAARVLAQTKPKKHVDISSFLYFVSTVSAFIPTQFYDYRPANLELSNLTEDSIDLLNMKLSDESIESLSCMHVIEHIGLGRYGDTIDPSGDKKAIDELKRVLKKGGDLLFVVPVGKPKIQFNAHRIYSYEQVLQFFTDYKLMNFSLIPDKEKPGKLIEKADPKLVAEQTYACGCFWFKK